MPRVLNRSSFAARYHERPCTPGWGGGERRRRRRGVCAPIGPIQSLMGEVDGALEGISDRASSRYLNHVGRKHRNRAHVHLYRYSATFIPSLFLPSTRRILSPLPPPLFFHLFFPNPAHFILLHHLRRPSVIRVSLIFSDRSSEPRPPPSPCPPLPRSIIAPSRDLIDDRFDYLRPPQSISWHTWVGCPPRCRVSTCRLRVFRYPRNRWDLIFPSIRSILTIDGWNY